MINKYIVLLKSLVVLTLKIWVTVLVLFAAIEWNANGQVANLISQNEILFIVGLVCLATSPMAFLLGLVLLFAKRVLINLPASFQFLFVLAFAVISMLLLGILIEESNLSNAILISVAVALLLYVKEISNPNVFSKNYSNA